MPVKPEKSRHHSARILLTGLAIADLIALKPTVINAIPVVTSPVPAKIHQLTGTRYAKLFNQVCIQYQARQLAAR